MPLILPNRRVLGVPPRVITGGIIYNTPGTYNLVIPRFNMLIVDVKGAAGGGSGACHYYDQDNVAGGGVGPGVGVGGSSGTTPNYTYLLGGNSNPGGFSQFRDAISGLTLNAGGGAGNTGGDWFHTTYQGGQVPQSSAGTGTGGNWTNNTGGGAAAGTYGFNPNCYSPAVGGFVTSYGGWGGNGGQAVSHLDWTNFAYLFGRTVTIVVGQGGAAGATPGGGTNGIGGGNGSVSVNWS
ncbi:hypothetical protein [Bradyrhizobium sp. th.b2]|uniref:hypothetical protein n=1 Tax=Bradyrhizobium sp. th-b2 TaxID=172088 RepID=UPI00048E70E4|nr:hypothetical protein [Bradyrhizobium sp. th.b2]